MLSASYLLTSPLLPCCYAAALSLSSAVLPLLWCPASPPSSHSIFFLFLCISLCVTICIKIIRANNSKNQTALQILLQQSNSPGHFLPLLFSLHARFSLRLPFWFFSSLSLNDRCMCLLDFSFSGPICWLPAAQDEDLVVFPPQAPWDTVILSLPPFLPLLLLCCWSEQFSGFGDQD